VARRGQSSERFRKEHPESDRLDRVAFQGAVAHFELSQFAKAGALLQTIRIRETKSGFGQHVIFLLAECHREQGDFKTAETLFDKAAYQMTGAFGAESLFRLGFVRFQLGDHAKAKRNFTDLLDDHPSSPHASSAKIYLGRAQLESGQYRQAEKTFTVFSPKDKGYPNARLWLARTHRAQQKFSQAEAVLTDAVKKAPKSPMRPDLLYDLATVQMDRKQFANAAVTFRKLGREFPKSPIAVDALWLEAFSLHKAGKFLDSADRCGNFLSRHPKNERCGEVAFLSAENLYLIDQQAEAESHYARFLKQYGSHAYSDSARFRMAQIRYQRKEWRATVEGLRALIEKEMASPFFDQLYFILGDCHFSLNQWDSAIEALRLFVEKHPAEPNADRALLKVALAAVNKGADAEAEAALKDFERRFPQSSYLDHALVELGRLHYEAGENSEARRVFTLAASTGKSPFAVYYLAYVALASGDEESAVKHFRSLEKRFPRHELVNDALLQQGIIEVRGGEFKKGEATLGRLAGREGDGAQADQALFYRAIAQARQELLRLLDTLDESVEFNIIAFSGRMIIWNRDGLQAGTPDNLASAKRFVRRTRTASDGTNTVGALSLALEDDKVKSIYFLSDGHPTVGFTTENEEILGHVNRQQEGRGVIINTIAYIKGDPPRGWRDQVPPKQTLIELMQRLAEQNDGNYVVFD